MRNLAIWGVTALLILQVGCGYENNPIGTTAEADSLREIIQLTSGFEKAGEAYFSKDMKWIVFQAAPLGQQQYQMYVAQVKSGDKGISGIGMPIRISPENSRNTCGYFSQDGVSIIFASTAGKEDPAEPQAGYQREGRDYVGSPGTELEFAL